MPRGHDNPSGSDAETCASRAGLWFTETALLPGFSLVMKLTLNGNSVAEQVTVQIRSIVGLWIGIADGIAPGDRVIVRGAERLSPGRAVEIIDTPDGR